MHSLRENASRSDVSAEVQEELNQLPLAVSGTVPSWLSGVLIRNGPVKVTVKGKSNEHWFDGLAMLHAFSFYQGKVHYSNKFLRSEAYHTVFDEGSLSYQGFASDPCRSLFKKFLTFFISHSRFPIQNANINVARLANEYVALTEVPLPVKFDPETLDTLGVLNYQDSLLKDKCWESAHPHCSREQKKTWNYLIKYGRKSYYCLYSVEEGTAERQIISEVPVKEPSYMHSFAVTENYVVFTEFPFVVKPLDLILKNQSFIKNFRWCPERKTQFIVVDKRSGKVSGSYTAKPFFAFHHANAFEKDGFIHMDIVTYEDADILTGESLYEQAKKASSSFDHSQLERFSLSLHTGNITSTTLLESSCEFPRINEKFDGKPYQYVYLTGINEKGQGDRLYKLHPETKGSLTWSEEGCSVGEPVFVEAPGAKEEDDGVVLSVVLDQAHKDSFLLILDGKSFQELGRARAPHLIPEGLHGQYFDKTQS